jgi:hypothetical protein
MDPPRQKEKNELLEEEEEEGSKMERTYILLTILWRASG